MNIEVQGTLINDTTEKCVAELKLNLYLLKVARDMLCIIISNKAKRIVS